MSGFRKDAPMVSVIVPAFNAERTIGDCLEALRAQAHRLGLDGHVTFTGRVGPAEIERYLRTAEIGLSPDPLNPLNDVSTMNKTMEYMAFSLPVVAFDLKETRVSAGDAGVYVSGADVGSFASAVAELLDEPERRAVMGSVGRRRVEEALAWHHQAPAYLAVYDGLLSALDDRKAAELTPA